MTRRKFAFLVHPRAAISEDLGRVFRPLRHVPDSLCSWVLENLPVPTPILATVFFSDAPHEPAGWILVVPLSARQMLALPTSVVQAKIESSLNKAAALGAEIVGLGSLTAPVTRGGQRLLHRGDIGVTNGNAFTAVMTYDGIRRLKERSPVADPYVAVVGATGSVGRCVVQLMALHPVSSRLLLVARNKSRLTELATEVKVKNPTIDVQISTDMDGVREADLVVLMTSSAESLLGSENLKHGALVLDDTQPRNTDPALLVTRPDVTIVDGGIVAIPGVRIKGDIGLSRGFAYACLAETMLLALDGHQGHFSIGHPTLDQAEQMVRLAAQYQQFGFTLAPFQSFGRTLPVGSGPTPHEATR